MHFSSWKQGELVARDVHALCRPPPSVQRATAGRETPGWELLGSVVTSNLAGHRRSGKRDNLNFGEM